MYTALVKINFVKYFCNTKVPGLVKIFSHETFQLYNIKSALGRECNTPSSSNFLDLTAQCGCNTLY